MNTILEKAEEGVGLTTELTHASKRLKPFFLLPDEDLTSLSIIDPIPQFSASELASFGIIHHYVKGPFYSFERAARHAKARSIAALLYAQGAFIINNGLVEAEVNFLPSGLVVEDDTSESDLIFMSEQQSMMAKKYQIALSKIPETKQVMSADIGSHEKNLLQAAGIAFVALSHIEPAFLASCFEQLQHDLYNLTQSPLNNFTLPNGSCINENFALVMLVLYIIANPNDFTKELRVMASDLYQETSYLFRTLFAEALIFQGHTLTRMIAKNGLMDMFYLFNDEMQDQAYQFFISQFALSDTSKMSEEISRGSKNDVIIDELTIAASMPKVTDKSAIHVISEESSIESKRDVIVDELTIAASMSKAPDKQTIRAISLDFDGCIFNRNYIQERNKQLKNVFNHNRDFFHILEIENTHFNKIVFYVGSNRQSESVDAVNATQFAKGSCFPAIEEIYAHFAKKHPRVVLDRFLLADIYGHLTDGESFALALKEGIRDPDEDDPKLKHAQWAFDETKASILYAQIHRLACIHSQENIVFDFYDDRLDILRKLKKCYERNSELIPSNVTLNLTHYAGGTVSLQASIVGKGFIDKNYRETVIEMAMINHQQCELPIDSFPDINHTYLVHKYLSLDRLTKRQVLTLPATEDSAILAGPGASSHLCHSLFSAVEKSMAAEEGALDFTSALKLA